MNQKIKDLFTKVACSHAENDFFANAAGQYLESLSNRIIDVQSAISATKDFTFNTVTSGGPSIQVSFPSIEQIQTFNDHNDLTEDQMSDMLSFFANVDRDYLREGHYCRGFTSSYGAGWAPEIAEDDPKWGPILQANLPDNTNYWTIQVRFDTYLLGLVLGIMYHRFKRPNHPIIWQKDSSVDYTDWYIYALDSSIQENFFADTCNLVPAANYNENNTVQPVCTIIKALMPSKTPLYREHVCIGNEANFDEVIAKFDDIPLFFTDNIEGNYLSTGLTQRVNGQDVTILLADGQPLTWLDLLIGWGNEILNECHLITISDEAPRTITVRPTVGDIDTFLRTQGIAQKQFMINDNCYTTVADIALAYICNNDDLDFGDGVVDSTDNEDEILVDVYDVNTHELLSDRMTMNDIRDNIVTSSTTYAAYAQMMSVYDESKTPGENLQMMLAAAQAKGLNLTEDASNLLDLVRTSQGAQAKTLFANLIKQLTPDATENNGMITIEPASISGYTGSSSMMTTVTTAGSAISNAAKTAWDATKKVASNLWDIAKEGLRKIKNKAADYLGIENMPFACKGDGDETIENGYTVFITRGDKILDDWSRVFMMQWDLDTQEGHTNLWYEITQSYLSNRNGASNYFSDRSALTSLSAFMGFGDYSNPSEVRDLLGKLRDRSPEIIHYSACCADVYVQCSTWNATIASSYYKIMLKWKPTKDGVVPLDLEIDSDATIGQVLATYFGQYANLRPTNLADTTAAQCKRFIENAKHNFWWSILAPLYLVNVDGYDLDAVADTATMNRLNFIFGLILRDCDVVNDGTLSFDSRDWLKPFWMYEHPESIADNAVTNFRMMQAARTFSKCHSNTNGAITNPDSQNAFLQDGDEVTIFNPWSINRLKYKTTDLFGAKGSWEGQLSDSTKKSCLFSQIGAMLIFGYLASLSEEDDAFIPYTWTDSISKGKYYIQDDTQESQELAVGLTTAIIVTIAVVAGGVVAAKKLKSLISLKKSARNLGNLEWQRSDLACQARNADYEISDIQDKFNKGQITKTEYEQSVANLTEKKTILESRYKAVVKQERKASRIVRRLTRWQTGKSALVSAAANKLSSNGAATDSNFIQSLSNFGNFKTVNDNIATNIASVNDNVNISITDINYIKDRI